jgi:hypothetical protein
LVLYQKLLMQADSPSIYKTVSEQTKEDLELVSTIGDFMQKEIANNLRHPKSLIIKVRGLGGWHLRRMRLKASYDRLKDYDYSKLEKLDEEVKEVMRQHVKNMGEMLKHYDLYLEEKAKAKKLKDEYYSKKSSEDNT